MSSVQKIFIASVSFLFLSACGLKGDLYLPEAEPQVIDTPAETVQETVEEVAPVLEESIKEESPTP